jgi:hypothetical protein
MYYNYKRRSSTGSFFLWLLISTIVILVISPRARLRLGSWMGSLSSILMGFGKDIGRQVNRVGINITDKFRTYKLADLAGGIKQTFTAKKENNVTSHEGNSSDIVYHDLTSEDDPDENVSDEDDTIKYPNN